VFETEAQEMCDLTVKRAGRGGFAPEEVRQVELRGQRNAQQKIK
jgi:hypothetical protein